MGKTAWVAGASGLVGGHLVSQLCQHDQYDTIYAFVRTPVDSPWSQHPKVKQWPADYDALAAPSAADQVNDVFCALGTTAKKTPDKAQYYKIDVAYPLAFADLALKHGAQFYGLVSAHGASASSLSGYLKMKGQLEQQLTVKAFPHQAFARPSLLKGERDEFRMVEQFSEGLMSLMPGNYKAIHAADVAAALIQAANTTSQDIEVLNSSSMQKASMMT